MHQKMKLLVPFIVCLYGFTHQGAWSQDLDELFDLPTKTIKAAPEFKAEDLDIISAILFENLESIFRTSAKGGSAANGDRLHQPLATRLPGYGVSIVVKTPPVVDMQALTIDDAQSKTTRWDATRKRLRGEKVSRQSSFHVAKTCKACHSGPEATDQFVAFVDKSISSLPNQIQIVERIVKTLAEEGHNLKGLLSSDRVTVTAVIPIGNGHAGSGLFPACSYLTAFSGLQPAGLQGGRNPLLTADLLFKQGRYQKAIDAYQKALEKEPENVLAWRKLVVASMRSGNADAAQRIYIDFATRRLSKKDADEATIRDTIRRLHLDLTGLPPDDSIVDEFVKDQSPDALDKLVARLLKHPEWSTRTPADGLLLESFWGLNPVGPTRTIRVTVSATKDQLDRVANKKISSGQFSESIQITYLEKKRE